MRKVPGRILRKLKFQQETTNKKMKEEVVVGGGLKTYKLFEEVIEVLFEALNCWSVEVFEVLKTCGGQL